MTSSVDTQSDRKTAMDLIYESVHTSDDVDIGNIEAISKEMIVVKRVSKIYTVTISQSVRWKDGIRTLFG